MDLGLSSIAMPVFLSERASLNSMTVSRPLPPIAASGLAGNSAPATATDTYTSKGMVCWSHSIPSPTNTSTTTTIATTISFVIPQSLRLRTADLYFQLRSLPATVRQSISTVSLTLLWSDTTHFKRQQTTTFLISYFSIYQKWVVAVTTKAILTGRNHLSPTDNQAILEHTVSKSSLHHLTSARCNNPTSSQ